MAEPTNEIQRWFEKLDKIHALEIEIARLQEKNTAGDRALTLARQALEHTQAASNEWRQENIDQRALFMTEEKVRGLMNAEEIKRMALEGRVVILEQAGYKSIGSHTTTESVWVKAIAVAGLFIGLYSIIAHYLKF
jgi:hypothetical protein